MTTGRLTMNGCWFCGAIGLCRIDCRCAKCVDPEGYDEWRWSHPDQYFAWCRSQGIEPECPGCGNDIYPGTDVCPYCFDISIGTP